MEIVLFSIVALGLILAKALLSGQERDLRNKRAKRKISQLQEDAARNTSMERLNEDEVRRPAAEPPPLPTKEDR